MNHDSPKEIRQTLEALGISLKKRWGQNFLINRGARERIVGLLDLHPDESAWEIGPGLGSMTDLIREAVGRLTLFEIDWKIIRYLRERYPRAAIVPGDVLKRWPEQARKTGCPDKVLGNLPYNTASGLLADFAERGFRPDRMVVTVQRELARRMRAQPGSVDYSAFTVVCRYRYRVVLHGDLQPGSFYPRPGVVSTVVELMPWASGTDSACPAGVERPESERLFFALVRRAFRSRRKTLKNNLVSKAEGGTREEAFDLTIRRTGIDPSRRGETLGIDEFVRLSNALLRALQDLGLAEDLL